METHIETPKVFEDLKKEISKVIIGQEDVIKQLFIALLCKSHVLLVGVPGLAKTTLIQSFSESIDLDYNRIQFTPDLMPSDITGNELLQENKTTGQRELIFQKGPIFTQILLADEINRTPPKTQAALLQAMQEKKVSVFGKTEMLSSIFMVLATQNPIEQEGTYPLPEAQLDRFIFSINMEYPSKEEEIQIAKRFSQSRLEKINPVLNAEKILELQNSVLNTPVSDHVFQHAVNIVRATRPNTQNSKKIVNDFVQWGAGPRASNFLILAAKANALLAGRPTPTEKDINEMLIPALNHRILLNFHAEAEDITVQKLLEKISSES